MTPACKVFLRVFATAILLSGLSRASLAGPLKIKQAFVGFNGPAGGGADHFDSEAAVRRSWIPAALEPRQLTDLLAQVDFRRQMVVTMAVGKFSASTGSVRIDAVETGGTIMGFDGPTGTDADGLLVRVHVGVPDRGCKYEKRVSYPFAIVIAERPAKLELTTSYDLYNFPDGCKPVKTGQPHETPTRKK